MQKIWFISDTHFHHFNVMRFHSKRRESVGITMGELESCLKIENPEDRHFAKEDIMIRHDNWLIKLWNNTIKKNDVIYILGDFCLGTKEYTEKLLNRLHGKKFLIKGNHDKSCQGLEQYFEWVGAIKEVKFNSEQYPFIKEGETFCVEMCHFPLLTWNRRTHGAVHACGHCHGSIDELNVDSGELRVDVGIDGRLADYNFISLEELYGYYRSIIESAGCETFQEYTENLIKKQGIRM